MFRHLKLETQGDIAIVRIDRPPANAMDLELLEEGRAVLAELEQDEPGAVVVTGRDGFFSAGVDLKVAPTLDAEQQKAMVTGINRLFAGWYGFPRPVVCAVNGHAIAGGAILTLCGDYRVGGHEGKLGLTELRAGVPYPAVAMAVVKAELTPQAARQLVLRADLVAPQRALELGILDELSEQVLERGLEVAAELAGLPRSAYAFVKKQFKAEAMDELLANDPALTGGWLSDETAGAAAGILDR